MKDLNNASFVLGIQIHKDHSKGILGLSQKTYIDKVLNRFSMQTCAPCDILVAKGDKFCLNQYLKLEIRIKEMKKFSYTLIVRSILYAQVCMHQDLVYIMEMFGRYLSNLNMDNWKTIKSLHIKDSII